MRIVDIIEKKKESKELTYDEIKELIMGYVNKQVPDYQISAFLMSVYFNSMTSKESSNLTNIMLHSGKVFDLSDIKGVKVDKHSTGGVGDKVTLILSPIVASLGAIVAKMSGPGLGFTGGTIDKLQSIKGFNTQLNEKQFKKQLKDIGLVVISQSKDIVPADKLLYSLRDVTATVDSMPLIASSIMSKKLATGADAILLDVKCGDGAFMKNIDEATKLAKEMIAIGKHLKKDVRAEITSMSRPLGRAIGNKIEVLEAIETLKGNGFDDVKEVIYSSGATLLMQAKIVKNYNDGVKLVKETIASGKALDKFKKWISYQGGKESLLFSDNFWKPKYKQEVKASKNGIMVINSAIDFGVAAMTIGAGREKKGDSIDYDAGIYLNKKTNEEVKKGDVLFTLYSSKEIPSSVIDSLKNAYIISDKKVKNEIILKRIG